MMHSRWMAPLAVAAAVAALTAGPATAQQAAKAPAGLVALVDTSAPGGFFGVNGFDVFEAQRVATRFTVPATGDHRLARVGIYFMNNSDSLQYPVRVSVQTDAMDEGGPETLPSEVKIASWKAPVRTLGWNPVEQRFVSKAAPRLKAGRHYWVVAESDAPPFVNPVWTFASRGTLVSTTTFNGAWQTAGSGAAPTMLVEAVPVE